MPKPRAARSVDKAAGQQGRLEQTPAHIARRLVRIAWKATLGTLARAGGHPYTSLVAVAAEPDGTPLLLMSGLAEHTRNRAADERASLLFDCTANGPDALTGPRVTLVGKLTVCTSSTARARYLARHPDAARFVDFGDFQFYALQVEWAHLVAGFGRIQRLEPGDVIAMAAGAGGLIAAEADILQHMNEDHSDAIATMAEVLGGGPPGASGAASWRMTGCDPDGIDLARGMHAVRLEFPQRIKTANAARKALIDLVSSARAAGAASR